MDNIYTLDFKDDVVSFRIVEKSTKHTSDIEFISNEILIAEQLDETNEAKLRELENWNLNQVYTQVPDTGQPFITLRWVVTQKPLPENSSAVKARLVARGFQESQEFRTDSPTCARVSIRLVLSLIASKEWVMKSLDIKTAFLQNETINRTVYVRPPTEAKTDKLWLLKKSIYGLADAPRCFYTRLKDVLKTYSVDCSIFDGGLFHCHSQKDDTLVGLIVCHVDDLLYGGTQEFNNEVIDCLRQDLQFGSEHTQAFAYIGMNVHQKSDSSIVVDQQSYAQNIQPIELESERLSSKQEPLSDVERTKYRALIGQLNWLSNISHPEISYEVCQASSRVKNAVIADIAVLNKVVHKVKQKQSFITFPPLKLDQLFLCVYPDASYNNLPDGGSQGGYIVLLCDNDRKCAPLTWRSTRIRRVVRSTLAAETIILNDGCDEAVYIRDLLNSIQPGIISNIIALSDNKSVADAAHTTTQVDDRSIRPEIAHLREYQENSVVNIFHIKGEDQLANVFTKRGASCHQLLSVLQSGKLPALENDKMERKK